MLGNHLELGRNLRHIALGVITGALILMILLLILPIKVVYDVAVTAKVYPSQEWKLVQDGEQFKTEERILSGSNSTSARNFVFERGDVVDILFDSSLADGALVSKNQELLSFRSMMHTMRIQRALNSIDIQQSLKIAGNAAMKWPLLNEAQEAVALAESNLRLQQANHDRMRALYADGVISKAELDAQVNRMEIANQELSIAKQRLANTQFEQKPEDIAVLDKRIETMDRELDVLLAQQSSYRVHSPMDGILNLNPEEGVVLSVRGRDDKTLLFQFPLDEKMNVISSSLLEVEYADSAFNMPFSLTSEIGIARGRQQCLGMAHSNTVETGLGEVISAKVVCDTVLLREYLFRKLL